MIPIRKISTRTRIALVCTNTFSGFVIGCAVGVMILDPGVGYLGRILLTGAVGSVLGVFNGLR